jgi:hypothetical protein
MSVRSASWAGWFLATLPVTLLVNACATQEDPPLLVLAPGSPIAVAGGPGSILLDDVNQDGRLDLIVACWKTKSITVLLGHGDGQFRGARGSPVQVPESPGEMALGDVYGDGRPDLAVASHDSYVVRLLLGDDAGGFALAPDSSVVMRDGPRPHTHGLVAGDLNGDGHPDLVTVNNADDDVSVALGDGRGGFTRAPGSPFGVGPSPYPATLADLDGDGHLDIVATATAVGPGRDEQVASTAALTVLLGDGRGGFRRGRIRLRTTQPWFVAVGDLNGDYALDLVVTHAERRELTVLVGDGPGGFRETDDSPLDLGHAAWRTAVTDVDRDGKADVVAAADSGVCVLLGDGRGGFTPAPGSPFPAGKGAWQLAVGDLNGDGRPDVVTSNLESDSVTVLLAQ